ncbi:probable G-protein coupled receptor 160 [Polyodon spathula]|uniref:probable G-protein coupled receptor 160 n=1 Tax=Polyodon spathula TaxID=7913 RepID=UPI001B7F52DC|nr:probable G-protein coupled receptor 160 [Polyodon spathula]XP_041125573.1 probable G-protein coupled receptor 160 [Polyodon spathula]
MDVITDNISSIQLALGVKALLNLTVIGLNWQYMHKSFMGYFCISLAFLDLIQIVNFSIIYWFTDFAILGFHITIYHIYFLLQISMLSYSILHWPVFIIAGLDYYWTFPFSQPLSLTRKAVYAASLAVVWISAVMYVFFVSDFNSEDSFLLKSQCTSLSLVVLAVITCVVIYCRSGFLSLFKSFRGKSYTEGSVSVFFYNLDLDEGYFKKPTLTCIAVCFIGTWFPFVCLQSIIMVFRIDVVSYLELNVPWLCFLNSFLIGAVYWHLNQDISGLKHCEIPDGFCNWVFSPSPDCIKKALPDTASARIALIIIP